MRRLSFFVQIIIVGILLHAYVGIRIIPELPVDIVVKGLCVLWLVLSVMLIPIGMIARSIKRQPLGDRLAWAGLLALGFYSSLLVLTFAREFLLLAVLIIGKLSPSTLDIARWRTDSASAVPLLALVSTAIGFFNARRRARVVSIDVPISDLPRELDGFTIVQISDIHVGPTIKRGYVDAIVDAVNRLKPDLIAVTGDVVDGSVEHLADHTRPLSRLSARHGAYLVTGNHEYYSGADAWIAEFKRLGLHVLMNEHVVVEHDGAQAVIAGVTDYSAGHFDPAHQSDPAAALEGAPGDVLIKVLLAHQPRSAGAAAEAGFTLQLSGHTHGGQFFPWNFAVKLQQPFVSGLARLDDMWIYTSRGTGYWGPPKRLGAPSEITRLRLTGA